jgi:hypothetical protein
MLLLSRPHVPGSGGQPEGYTGVCGAPVPLSPTVTRVMLWRSTRFSGGPFVVAVSHPLLPSSFVVSSVPLRPRRKPQEPRYVPEWFTPPDHAPALEASK